MAKRAAKATAIERAVLELAQPRLVLAEALNSVHLAELLDVDSSTVGPI